VFSGPKAWSVLHREFPLRPPLDLRKLTARSERLQRISEENFPHYEPLLGHPEMVYPQPLQAYRHDDGAEAQIELVNILPVAVEVTSLGLQGPTAKRQPIEPAPPHRHAAAGGDRRSGRRGMGS
jgi:hypothetical protein